MDFAAEFSRILRHGPWPSASNAEDFLWEHRNDMTREQFAACCEDMRWFAAECFEQAQVDADVAASVSAIDVES